MTAQILDRVLTCYRIGDAAGEFSIFDAAGSRLHPGRWNTEHFPIVYASEHFSTAMLETLANNSGDLPPNQHYIDITVPNGVSYEVVTGDVLPGWDRIEERVSQAFGERWCAERRSAILLVPSHVARVERNVLINPSHPEFPRIRAGLHAPVWWDSRLFGRRAARARPRPRRR